MSVRELTLALAIALTAASTCTQAQSTEFAASAAGNDSAEAVLAALKHALVDAAQEQTVTVTSSAFIDSSGALVESNFFDTQATVRGVRVLEYLPAPQQAPIDHTAALPASLRNARDGICAVTAATQYRPTLLISTRTLLGPGRINDADAGLIKQSAHALLGLHTARSGHWVAVHENELAAQLSQYERLLTGLVPFDSADYELRWTLSNTAPTAESGLLRRIARQSAATVDLATRLTSDAARTLVENNPIAPLNLPATDSATTLYHQLALIDRRSGTTLHVHNFDIRLPRSDSLLRRDPPLLASEVTSTLGPQLDVFYTYLARVHGCQFRQFAVLPTLFGRGDNQQPPIQIRVGEVNNAKVGDRFLIIETPWEGGQQTLNTNLVGSLSIGEIVHVDRYQSTLQLIAGNGTAGDLKFALPF